MYEITVISDLKKSRISTASWILMQSLINHTHYSYQNEEGDCH